MNTSFKCYLYSTNSLLNTDGPDIVMSNRTELIAPLGDNVSLNCGSQLSSNPRATIRWYQPNGAEVKENSTYTLDNGPDIVRLNVSDVSENNSGFWNCTVSVWGWLTLRNETVNIGYVSLGIQLIVWSKFIN